MTITTPNLDSLLATAPDDQGVVLLAYSAALLGAASIDDLATPAFAKTARKLGKPISVVRSDFARVQGYHRAVSAFDAEKLRIAQVEETQTRKADALYSRGGRFAHEFVGHNELQPTAALRMVELDARRRDAETPEQREAIRSESQAVKAEGERLAHRAKAASGVVEELLHRRDKIQMISQGDLFVALNNEPTE